MIDAESLCKIVSTRLVKLDFLRVTRALAAVLTVSAVMASCSDDEGGTSKGKEPEQGEIRQVTLADLDFSPPPTRSPKIRFFGFRADQTLEDMVSALKAENFDVESSPSSYTKAGWTTRDGKRNGVSLGATGTDLHATRSVNNRHNDAGGVVDSDKYEAWAKYEGSRYISSLNYKASFSTQYNLGPQTGGLVGQLQSQLGRPVKSEGTDIQALKYCYAADGTTDPQCNGIVIDLTLFPCSNPADMRNLTANMTRNKNIRSPYDDRICELELQYTDNKVQAAFGDALAQSLQRKAIQTFGPSDPPSQ